MPRRKSAWYEFTSSMPTAADLRPDPVKTVPDKIEDIKADLKARKIKDVDAINALNKLYINHVVTGKDMDQISMENKVMLTYAYLSLSGEREKMERRKGIVLSFLNH